MVDPEVELVAHIAAALVTTGRFLPKGATEYALQIVEHAGDAVESRRGVVRDWEALEAAAAALVVRRRAGVFSLPELIPLLVELEAALQRTSHV